MSVTGIASNILSAISGSQNYQSKSQQIQSEFAQLGQDLQSGSLSAAQSDFATLSQNLPGASQNSTAATTTSAATTSNSPIAQAFAQLGQDLQSGNLTGAQQLYANIQQDAQQNIQQIQSEFQQLGQDLQSGNLSAAQSDFAALSQNLPGASQNSTAATTTSAATTSNSPIAQAFAQLGQDLQSGNLTGAQQLYTSIQQDVQQNTQQNAGNQQVGGHHHRHHTESSQASSSSSSSQTNPVVQAFGQLAQSLQSGNLSGAQSAFSALQTDLQQIGGFVSSGASSTAASTVTGGLDVTA